MALSTSRARADRFRALDKGLRAALVRRLHRFFIAQARRVAERYGAEFPDTSAIVTQPPSAEELLPDAERRELWSVVLPIILQAILNAANLAGELVGIPGIEPTDPRVHRLVNDAQAHMAEVHDTTLAAIRGVLTRGFRERWTVGQMTAELAATVAEIYANRTLTIARTELANVRQLASLERYQEAGIAMVHVIDGPDCGWTHHGDPDQANRSVRHMIDAREYALSHPNCQRVCLPLR